VAKLLADFGADLNVSDEQHCTPLMVVCRTERVEFIEFLCDRHVDINAEDAYGLTALCISCFFAQVEAVRILLARGARVDCGVPCSMVVLQPFPEDELDEGMTMNEFMQKRRQIVQQLVAHNVDFRLVDASGIALLTHVKKQGNKELASILLEAIEEEEGWETVDEDDEDEDEDEEEEEEEEEA